MITDSDVTMNVRRGRGTIARRQTSWSRNLPGYDPSQQNVEGQNRLVQNLLGMTRSELEHFALKFDQPRYRGAQLYRAIYNRRARRFPELTDLNRGFRQFLAANYDVRYPTLEREFASRDGSVRYLLGLGDGEAVEAVYIPEEHRVTLCISSQVGCAVDCRFCFTALVGMKRNLTAGEIVGQVLVITQARAIPRHARVNVVFMGQGAPLLNYTQAVKAEKILAAPPGMSIVLNRHTA